MEDCDFIIEAYRSDDRTDLACSWKRCKKQCTGLMKSDIIELYSERNEDNELQIQNSEKLQGSLQIHGKMAGTKS